MIQRCCNSNDTVYEYYGGRGITVCERWLSSFENFLADMGEKPKGLTLDRRSNNGDYEPDNCRWATPAQQMNNTRRNVFLEYNGQTKTIADWGRIVGIKPMTIHTRLSRNWTIERALVTPVQPKQRMV